MQSKGVYDTLHGAAALLSEMTLLSSSLTAQQVSSQRLQNTSEQAGAELQQKLSLACGRPCPHDIRSDHSCHGTTLADTTDFHQPVFICSARQSLTCLLDIVPLGESCSAWQ